MGKLTLICAVVVGIVEENTCLLLESFHIQSSLHSIAITPSIHVFSVVVQCNLQGDEITSSQ